MATYLYTNCLLYLALALWCIVSPEKTSEAVGFQLLSGSGRSEYFVVYGGLQLGLAIFFGFCAWQTDWNWIGIVFAACLYLPIFCCRALSFIRYEGIGSVTIATAGLEAFLTIWVLYLLFTR